MVQKTLFDDEPRALNYDAAFMCPKCNQISPLDWWWGNDRPEFALHEDENGVECFQCGARFPYRVSVTAFAVEEGKLAEIMSH